MRDHLRVELAALEDPAKIHRGRLVRYVDGAHARIIDRLSASVEIIDSLCGPPAIAD